MEIQSIQEVQVLFNNCLLEPGGTSVGTWRRHTCLVSWILGHLLTSFCSAAMGSRHCSASKELDHSLRKEDEKTLPISLCSASLFHLSSVSHHEPFVW